MKLKRSTWVAAIAWAAMAAGVLHLSPHSTPFAPPRAEAQNLGQRVVFGFVSDANSTPVTGATVFLKDLKTKSIRSFTSVADGKFRFAQVNMNDDQELWAEKDGQKSAVKTVSSWDTRKEFEVELRLK